MRIRCRSRLPWRISSWPAANGIRCVKPSSATLAPSATCAAIASRSESACTRGLLHHRARLLAQVLLQVVEGRDRLAGRSRSFPAAEGLVARPRAGRRALGTIGVGDARFDMVLEPRHFVGTAIEAGGEAHVGV